MCLYTVRLYSVSFFLCFNVVLCSFVIVLLCLISLSKGKLPDCSRSTLKLYGVLYVTNNKSYTLGIYYMYNRGGEIEVLLYIVLLSCQSRFPGYLVNYKNFNIRFGKLLVVTNENKDEKGII